MRRLERTLAALQDCLVVEKPYKHVAVDAVGAVAAAAGVKLQLKKRWKNLIQ